MTLLLYNIFQRLGINFGGHRLFTVLIHDWPDRGVKIVCECCLQNTILCPWVTTNTRKIPQRQTDLQSNYHLGEDVGNKFATIDAEYQRITPIGACWCVRSVYFKLIVGITIPPQLVTQPDKIIIINQINHIQIKRRKSISTNNDTRWSITKIILKFTLD